jgi:hypothetical protein
MAANTRPPPFSWSPPPQDACYPQGAAPLAACLLRLVLACPPPHSAPQALTLAENLLRHFAMPHAASSAHSMHGAHAGAGAAQPPGGPGVRGLMRRHGGSFNSLTSAAVVIPVVPASHASTTTVTQAAELHASPASPGVPPLPPGAGAGALPAAADVAVPEGMRHAVAAADGLPDEALLGAAAGAARAARPLLAAFALQRLRAGVMLLDKQPWQQLIVQVRQNACEAFFLSWQGQGRFWRLREQSLDT